MPVMLTAIAAPRRHSAAAHPGPTVPQAIPFLTFRVAPGKADVLQHGAVLEEGKNFGVGDGRVPDEEHAGAHWRRHEIRWEGWDACHGVDCADETVSWGLEGFEATGAPLPGKGQSRFRQSDHHSWKNNVSQPFCCGSSWTQV